MSKFTQRIFKKFDDTRKAKHKANREYWGMCKLYWFYKKEYLKLGPDLPSRFAKTFKGYGADVYFLEPCLSSLYSVLNQHMIGVN